jgi:hypothetical protein
VLIAVQTTFFKLLTYPSSSTIYFVVVRTVVEVKLGFMRIFHLRQGGICLRHVPSESRSNAQFKCYQATTLGERSLTNSFWPKLMPAIVHVRVCDKRGWGENVWVGSHAKWWERLTIWYGGKRIMQIQNSGG